MPTLIIAGPSNVGKTTAASALASDTGWPLLSVDDLALASAHPALAFEREETVWRHPPRVLCELLVRKGEALWPDVLEQIDSHGSPGQPIIIEGEGPWPDAVTGLNGHRDIRAAFIVERDPTTLDRTLRHRSKRFRALPAWQQSNVVQMNVLYGEWLIGRCEGVGVPWLASQPWSTLRNRLTVALRLS